jgi:ATP-dependent exoDNAse (exonuclease V) alpha subunit
MATYFLRSRHISRGKGARATRAAAYRAGERILDERTSEVYDHSNRNDVAHKEVVLPSDLAGRDDMAWTQNRATLWNAMEHAGLRRNSRVAREWLALLPQELTPEQRSRLVRTFATELSNKYRCAVDCTIHQPRPGADPRNFHTHLLMTTREVSPDGIGARTTLELCGRERHQDVRGRGKQQAARVSQGPRGRSEP